jgi:ribonuclease J
MVTAAQVSGSQDKLICCFSFFDVNELAYIRPVPGSIWLFSSCEAFSEEMAIDFERLGHWIEKYEMAFPGDPRRKPGDARPDAEKNPFHVSGHACREDLLKVIEIIGPQVVIPVHTEKPDVYAKALPGRKVILPERGVPIEL